jgi:hypothetical protein
MPSIKNFTFTCEHNPFVMLRVSKNRENKADTKNLLALHVSATDDPTIVSEAIGSLLRFEKIHNKGEFAYNMIIEFDDGEQIGVSKKGTKDFDFNVRETTEWLVQFLTE